VSVLTALALFHNPAIPHMEHLTPLSPAVFAGGSVNRGSEPIFKVFDRKALLG
jgi:hypothetical protein